MKTNLTQEDIEWVRENYLTTSTRAAAAYLKIGYRRLKEITEELGLHKKPVEVKPKEKKKKKVLHEDEDTKGYCMDCKIYQYGGICAKSDKWVGALWRKKCFKEK